MEKIWKTLFMITLNKQQKGTYSSGNN